MKTVLITGASWGIGRETAIYFAEKGYMVRVNYNKSKAAAEKLCEEINSRGGSAIPVFADVSEEASVKKMFDEILSESPTLDVLVNNAGIAPVQGLFTDFSDSDARRVFDTNVFGMMNCCRAATLPFVRQKHGKIVNVSSVWGISGAACEVIYSASKAAVIGFTKALAKELAPSGINVNCAAPGFIDTEMNAHLSDEDKELFCDEIPLGRLGAPLDAAKLIYFLASADADYITGQVFTVDGGLL